jgi:hypothetical protein
MAEDDRGAALTGETEVAAAFGFKTDEVGFSDGRTSDGWSPEGEVASRSLDSKGETVQRGGSPRMAGNSLFKGAATVRVKS